MNLELEKEARMEYDRVLYGQKEKIEIRTDVSIPEKKIIDGVIVNQDEINDATRNKQNRQQDFIRAIFRYAIHYYMGWSTEEARQYMRPEDLKKMHLDTLIKKLDIPVYIPDTHMAYILTFALEGEKAAEQFFDAKSSADSLMSAIEHGDIQRLPKGALDPTTEAGRQLAAAIMRRFLFEHIIEAHTDAGKQERGRILYEKFTNESDEILKLLKENYLDCMCATTRPSYANVLEALHAALDEDEKNDLTYLNAQYELTRKKAKEYRKKKR